MHTYMGIYQFKLFPVAVCKPLLREMGAVAYAPAKGVRLDGEQSPKRDPSGCSAANVRRRWRANAIASSRGSGLRLQSCSWLALVTGH